MAVTVIYCCIWRRSIAALFRQQVFAAALKDFAVVPVYVVRLPHVRVDSDRDLD